MIHNKRITDVVFRQALDFLDEGNALLLSAHLAANPNVVRQRVHLEGDNYFSKPRLIEFVAENPIRKGRLPANIVEITKIILDAGAKDHQSSLDYALGLTASGRIARESAAQIPLIDLLCDYGAEPETAMHTALAHREFAAAHQLVARGASIDLPSAAAMNIGVAVADLLPGASTDQVQLGLALAANNGWHTIVATLLKAGADPNRFNPAGAHAHCTPLHSAAIEGHFEAVKALVERGARADIGDIHHGATAIAWAEHAGHAEIATFLKDAQ